MHKKLLQTLSIFLTLAVLLFGCSANGAVSPQNTSAAEKKFTIVTSFYPIYVATINITKGIPGVEVVNMTTPQTGCLHDYQLTSRDMETLEGADAFVINGAGMEAFMDKVINQQKSLKIIQASTGIPLLRDHNGDDNPHVWVSITNEIAQVGNIAAGLEGLDTANKARYQQNAADYTAKLTALQVKMHQQLDGLKNRDIITMHEAFPYFAAEFKLNIAAIIEREPGTDPTAQELGGIIDTVNKTGIKALFAEPQYSTKSAEAIARETGAKVWTLNPAVTGPTGPSAYDAYLQAMEENLKTLTEALK